MLVPDDPDLLMSVVDVRDLADWLVEAGGRGLAGALNATGPALPLAEHLETARAVAGHTGPVVRGRAAVAARPGRASRGWASGRCRCG